MPSRAHTGPARRGRASLRYLPCEPVEARSLFVRERRLGPRRRGPRVGQRGVVIVSPLAATGASIAVADLLPRSPR